LPSPEPPANQTPSGLALSGTAYLIWGLAPIYWKQLAGAEPGALLAHRVIWALVLLILIQIVRGRLGELLAGLKSRAALGVIALTAVLVAANWFTFIYAVLSDRILQTSLGYYMNPLVSIVLGVIFLGDRMHPPQWIAVLLATCGVTWLVLQGEEFPTPAIVLAMTFGFYGLLRKTAPVGSLTAQTMETLYLVVPALVYLLAFEAEAGVESVGLPWLMGTGALTAVPLLLFGAGVRKLSLVTIGFLQYTAPTLSFLIGVYVYGEPFDSAQQVAFAFIWAAVLLYTVDSVRRARRARATALNDPSAVAAAPRVHPPPPATDPVRPDAPHRPPESRHR